MTSNEGLAISLAVATLIFGIVLWRYPKKRATLQGKWALTVTLVVVGWVIGGIIFHK